MADFTPIAEKTLILEGGYQSFPNDSANYTSSHKLVGTNFGISAIAYEDYLGREPSIEDMKALTKAKALAVYKKNFWDKLQGDKIKNHSVAHIIFDAYIASGSLGIQRVRKYINEYTGYSRVSVSRISNLNDDEIKAINGIANQKALFELIKQGEIDARMALVNSNPAKYGQFKQGWINRLNKINYEGRLLSFGKVATGVAIVVTPVILVGVFFLGKLVYNKWIKK